MQMSMLLLFAALMGVISVDLFSRAWKGFLGIIADVILFARRDISRRSFFSRLSTHLGITLVCSLGLLLCFHVYLNQHGLGKTEAEQLFYFLASVIRLAIFLKHVGKDMDALLAPDSETDDED